MFNVGDRVIVVKAGHMRDYRGKTGTVYGIRGHMTLADMDDGTNGVTGRGLMMDHGFYALLDEPVEPEDWS